MDAIPDWVGNRDLVVGPALFRAGTVEGQVPEVRAIEPEVVEEAYEAIESIYHVMWDRY